MTSKNQTQQEFLHDQLAGITETMQRENIKLTPKVSAYLKNHAQAVQGKLLNGQKIYPKDMEFIKQVKSWMNMPEKLRKEFPSIERMENGFKLSRKQKEALLARLKVYFKQFNQHLHEGLEWDKILQSLKAKEEYLWIINKMEQAGHEPDVYNWDDEGFDIGTCSLETPAAGIGCVYDKKAGDRLKKENPNAGYYGNAVDMVKEMKAELMTEEQYRILLKKSRRFDLGSKTWIKTPEDKRKLGGAQIGSGSFSLNVVGFTDPTNQTVCFRVTLRVPWKQ